MLIILLKMLNNVKYFIHLFLGIIFAAYSIRN